MSKSATIRVVVIASASAEWRAVRAYFPDVTTQESPMGEWFVTELEVSGTHEPVCFFHGGWGKISAAASAQYVIDRWNPRLLVNLGTCGGFEGAIERGTVVLAERTIVYDIVELMDDYSAALEKYMTDIDLNWLSGKYPHPVVEGVLVSADRDLLAEDIPTLREVFEATAGDWESGAIAYVAARNKVRCLILRGVSDLVSAEGGEAYDNVAFFTEQAQNIMTELLGFLPAWIAKGL